MRWTLERFFRAATTIVFVTLAALATASCSRSEPAFRVAVIGFEEGGPWQMRNRIAEYGVRRVEGELGVSADFFIPQKGEDLGRLFVAGEDAYDLVIALGASSFLAALDARPQGWEGALVALDFEGDLPVSQEGGITLVRYRVEEGTYVCGYLAAWLSARNEHPLTNSMPLVAFMGARDNPQLAYYVSGFDRGVKAGAPKAGSLDYYLEREGDVKTARAFAEEAVKKGADIIFCAPGSFNSEVLKVASEKKVLVMLSGTDRGGESPDHVLTSLVLRDDNAIFEAVRAAMEGDLSPGKLVWGDEQGTWSLAPYRAHDGYIGKEIRSILEEQAVKARGMDFSS